MNFDRTITKKRKYFYVPEFSSIAICFVFVNRMMAFEKRKKIMLLNLLERRKKKSMLSITVISVRFVHNV